MRPGPLCSKIFQKTLILAFEANSALSRENETKIVKITHSVGLYLARHGGWLVLASKACGSGTVQGKNTPGSFFWHAINYISRFRLKSE